MENNELIIPGEDMEDMPDIVASEESVERTEHETPPVLPTKPIFDKLIERTISENNFGVRHAPDSEKKWLTTAYDMVREIWQACSDFADQYDMETIDQRILAAIPTIMSSILDWRPSTVVFGDDDEWVDEKETFDSFTNKEMWFTEEHIEGTSIQVTSIERNIRFPALKRFNHDNRYAHILDAVYYVNKNGEPINPIEYRLSPIRFIVFPYRWQVPVTVIFDTENRQILGINGDATKMFTMPKCMIDMMVEKHPEYFEIDEETLDDEENDDLFTLEDDEQ